MNERHDLDGLRLFRPGEPDVWLVFHGKRHRVASPAVFEALFANADGLKQEPDPSVVPEGAPLEDGSCLVRPDDEISYYLVTRDTSGLVRRHLVANWESWCDFGFDESKVVTVPSFVLQAVPLGRDLSTPSGRRHLT